MARARLNSFVTLPAKHISYTAKVLLKFKLLEVQTIALDELITWASPCISQQFSSSISPYSTSGSGSSS